MQLLDEGRPCPGPLGGRWHYSIELDGKVWNRGDQFFVIDHRRVPRPMVFMYHYTGNGETICYSQQRFRRPDERVSVPVGCVVIDPSVTAVSMDRTEIAVRQTAADLEDAGLIAEAASLLDVFENDGMADEVAEALAEAKAALAALDDEDDEGEAA
jgi:hypothetical protein